jgi:hypothetical protein
MPESAAAPRPTYRILSFPISDVFPVSDPVAMDLLCLIAGYTDLEFLTEWLDEHLPVPDGPAERAVAADRWFLQLRFITSILYEILNVLDNASPEFKRIEESLDEEGKVALGKLREVRSGPDKTLEKLLDRTRNRGTFHYDKDQLKKGLERFKSGYGNDCKSTLIIKKDSQGDRPHHSLAEQVRTEMAFGFIGKGEARPELDAATDLLEHLKIFLDSAFQAYLQDRKLENVFEETHDLPR